MPISSPTYTTPPDNQVESGLSDEQEVEECSNSHEESLVDPQPVIDSHDQPVVDPRPVVPVGEPVKPVNVVAKKLL